jgi:RNA polymerase sigma-70 factor, ECF subfamily
MEEIALALNDYSVTLDDMNVLNDESFNHSEPRPAADQVSFGPDDRGYVYAVARRIVGSAEDAEDVTQETLLLAYRNRAAFRGESRYRTWLYRIAFTTAVGFLRRRGRSREALVANDEAFARQLEDGAPSPEEHVIEAELAAVVRGAIDELSPAYRDVLLARIDATEPEVARRLGLSVANVKVRAHRARHQLRHALAGSW